MNDSGWRIVTRIIGGLLFLGVLALLYFHKHPDLLRKYLMKSEGGINTMPVSHVPLELRQAIDVLKAKPKQKNKDSKNQN